MKEMNTLSNVLSYIIKYITIIRSDQPILNMFISDISDVIYNIIRYKIDSPFDVTHNSHLELYLDALNEVGSYAFYNNIVDRLKQKLTTVDLYNSINIYFLFFAALSQHKQILKKLKEVC
mgnify:CR=1 FL=1